MIIRRILIAAVILLGTLAMLALYHPDLRPRATPSGGTGGTVAIGGPFTLTDARGGTFTEANLKGAYSLIFFGFTHCPDICPLTLQVMTDAIEQAGPAGERVTPVFVTVDPERDTAEAVGAYVGAFHPRFVGLTGTPEQVAGITKAYRVFARKAPLKDAEGRETGDYTVEHTGIIFLMDPEGRYLTHFSNGTPAEEMAAYLRREAAK
jgi:cytochrome oxidase Cu insertion factor (SCO1/SenC/PrrC family)